MEWLKQIKRIRTADYVDTAPKDLLAAVREQGLEGIIGKQIPLRDASATRFVPGN